MVIYNKIDATQYICTFEEYSFNAEANLTMGSICSFLGFYELYFDWNDRSLVDSALSMKVPVR